MSFLTTDYGLQTTDLSLSLSSIILRAWTSTMLELVRKDGKGIPLGRNRCKIRNSTAFPLRRTSKSLKGLKCTEFG